MVRGSVDAITTTEVHGWAYCAGRTDPVLIQAVLSQEIIGEAVANLHRADLAAAGFGDGNSGYVIKLYRQIDPLYLPFLVVKIDAGDAELPRAPALGFTEFFSALHAAHPASGRQRSVLGGLWTDRTDASSLLRGKSQIGQVSEQSAPIVEKLIHDGFAVIGVPALGSASAWRNNPTEELCSLLDERDILLPLQAVLEDNPLVLKMMWVENEEKFAQPSGRNVIPSPAECLELIIAIEGDISLEVVRGGHLLPEFTLHGASRWTSFTTGGVASVAGPHGLLDRYPLPCNAVVVVSPGTIYRLRTEPGCAGVRVSCLPSRSRPLTLASESQKAAIFRESGVSILV